MSQLHGHAPAAAVWNGLVELAGGVREVIVDRKPECDEVYRRVESGDKTNTRVSPTGLASYDLEQGKITISVAHILAGRLELLATILTAPCSRRGPPRLGL